MTEVLAPMVGKFVQYNVNEGDSVKKDDLVATLEAMKMYVKVFAPADGVVKNLNVKPGDVVEADAVLMTIE